MKRFIGYLLFLLIFTISCTTQAPVQAPSPSSQPASPTPPTPATSGIESRETVAPVALQYPDAERLLQVDIYHGVEVADPYRWFEELDSAQTNEWVRAQNQLSQDYLESISIRKDINERITELWDYERYGIPGMRGGRYFYYHNDGLQNQSVLYTADSLDSEPQVLIDPNTFSDDGTISLAGTSVSPNARYIAYAVSDAGSDWKTWNIRDIETGKDLAEELRFIKFSGVSWTLDSSGFYYSRYAEGPDGKGDDSTGISIYYHTIAEPQSQDLMVFSIPDNPRKEPYGGVTQDGQYLIILVQEGYDANAIYYQDISEPESEVIRLLDKWDALYSFVGNDDSTFFFMTTKDAPRYRLVGVDINNPDISQWHEIIPEADEAILDTSYIGGHFIIQYLSDVISLVKVFDRNGAFVRDVDLPGIGNVYGFGGYADNSETFYAFTGFTTPDTIYRYDVETGTSTIFHAPETGIDLTNTVTRQVFYPSKDGTRIPMFIIHQKDINLDGQNPTLLYGYGGFNVSLTPYYSSVWAVWMEMGGVLAIPNLRGGGEYGEDWHEAGTKLNKQNVFDDFIAAAEWLLDNNYTSIPKLAIQGGSNGGLLVGAVMTQRPDLFGACLPDVGVLDMLRYHLASANAFSWSSDYGLSENKGEFQALYAYSPYHNIEEGVCYPPTLITTADHDDRVVPWHSYKFGAQLQYTQKCDNPILVRVETRAGHGAGMPTWMRIEKYADEWAFLYQVLHMK